MSRSRPPKRCSSFPPRRRLQASRPRCGWPASGRSRATTSNCPRKSPRRSPIFPSTRSGRAFRPGERACSVPPSCSQHGLGRSFFLVFPANNLNTTLYVNGKFCGFDKNPFVRLQFDVTSAIKPGSERDLGGNQGRLVRLRHRPQGPMQAAPPLEHARGGSSRAASRNWSIRSGTRRCPASSGRRSWLPPGRSMRPTCSSSPPWPGKQLGLEITLKNPGRQERLRRAALRGGRRQDRRRSQWSRAAAGLHARCGEGAGARLRPEMGKRETLVARRPELLPPAHHREARRQAGRRAGDPLRLPGVDVAGCDMKLNGVRWQGFSEQSNPGKTPETWIPCAEEPENQLRLRRMWPQHDGVFSSGSAWSSRRPWSTWTVTARWFAPRAISTARPPVTCRRSSRSWARTGSITSPAGFAPSQPSVHFHVVGRKRVGLYQRPQPWPAQGLGADPAQAWEVARKVDPTRPIMVDGGGADQGPDPAAARRSLHHQAVLELSATGL